MSFASLPSKTITGITRGQQNEIRTRLIEEQSGLCIYCQKPFPVAHHGHRSVHRASIDHIEAKANGGTDAMSNLVVACYSCNSRKSDYSLLIFLMHRLPL